MAPPLWRAAVLVAAVSAVALWLRYGLIEPDAVAAACLQATAGDLRCTMRSAAIALLHQQRIGLGAVALLAAGLALGLAGGRMRALASALAWGAVAAGALALWLYAPEWGLGAVLAGTWWLVARHPVGAPQGGPADRRPEAR